MSVASANATADINAFRTCKQSDSITKLAFEGTKK